MNDPRTVREIAEENQLRITRLEIELTWVKTRVRLIERQLGWDSDALEAPADDEPPLSGEMNA